MPLCYITYNIYGVIPALLPRCTNIYLRYQDVHDKIACNKNNMANCKTDFVMI